MTPAPGLKPVHLDLLRSCLLDGEQAAAACRRWLASADIERLEHGAIRLLPLLVARHPSAVLPKRLAGVARQSWTRTQSVRVEGGEARAALSAEGVEPVLLQGAALAAAVYGDDRLRPVGDLDLLLARADIDNAGRILEASGWRRTAPEPDEARVYLGARGARLRIRCMPLLEAWRDTGVEAGSRSCAWHGTEWRVLEPELLLVTACVYGLHAPGWPPVRWAADVAHLLRVFRESLNWGRVVDVASRWRVLPYLQMALSFVAAEGFAPLPREAPAAGSSESRELGRWLGLQRYMGQAPRWRAHCRERGCSFASYLRAMYGSPSWGSLLLSLARAARMRWARGR